MRLLVVEDERELAHTLKDAFEEDSFAVDVCLNGTEGLAHLLDSRYDAAIVDIMLPGRDGWALITEVRRSAVRTPILILTARSSVSDRVRGLNLGADDYLGKPFALTEVLARVHAMVRRSSGHPSPTLCIRDVVIDTIAKQVYRAELPIELTAREYAILTLLIRHRGRLVSRDMIYSHIYDESGGPTSNVIDVHVASLRRKLGDDLIQTRRGEGYIIDA
jgi:two-component system OmpR family response regulator